MIWSISWKNVWRNINRSLVVITSVTLGIISGILMVGIMKGWVEQRMHDAVYNEVSHIQIHNPEFLNNEEILSTVIAPETIATAIESIPGVSGWVSRTKLTAMAATPWAGTGLFVYGIDPEGEKKVTEIHKKIVEQAGEYLNSSAGGSILISDKTAELLKLKQYIVTEKMLDDLRGMNVPAETVSKLSIIKGQRYRSPKDFKNALKATLGQKELDRYGEIIIGSALDYRLRNRIQITLADPSGNPVQGTFRVCGIYKTTNAGFDQSAAYVNKHDLAALYGSEEPLVHEIAIMLTDISGASVVKSELLQTTPQNSVSTWKELAPDAAMMNDYMVMYYFIFIGIILLALAFGIINTMMMAILERTKELGMLMAIGMNRKKVFKMIMLETTFLTGVGASAGIFAGWGLVEILAETGIRFSAWGEGFEAMGFSAVVYPFITVDFFIFIVLMVIVTSILASIGPARKALKLNPVETLRTE